MAVRPQLAFPVSLTTNGTLRVVEQDSEADVAGCIAVILSWPQGTRRSLPDFGIPPQVFEQNGPHLDELREAVLASEPRAEHFRATLLSDPGLKMLVQAGYGIEPS